MNFSWMDNLCVEQCTNRRWIVQRITAKRAQLCSCHPGKEIEDYCAPESSLCLFPNFISSSFPKVTAVPNCKHRSLLSFNELPNRLVFVLLCPSTQQHVGSGFFLMFRVLAGEVIISFDVFI